MLINTNITRPIVQENTQTVIPANVQLAIPVSNNKTAYVDYSIASKSRAEENALNAFFHAVYNAIKHLFTGIPQADVEEHIRTFADTEATRQERARAFCRMVKLATPNLESEQIPVAVSDVYSLIHENVDGQETYILKMDVPLITAGRRNQEALEKITFEVKFQLLNELELKSDDFQIFAEISKKKDYKIPVCHEAQYDTNAKGSHTNNQVGSSPSESNRKAEKTSIEVEQFFHQPKRNISTMKISQETKQPQCQPSQTNSSDEKQLRDKVSAAQAVLKNYLDSVDDSNNRTEIPSQKEMFAACETVLRNRAISDRGYFNFAESHALICIHDRDPVPESLKNLVQKT